MRIIIVLIVIVKIYAQPLDLSQDWNTNADFIFSNELEEVISTNISVLPNILGLIIIHNNEIVSENYYNGSNEDDIYNIWSVTKSYISTLIGQAYDIEFISSPNVSISNFLPNSNINQLEMITLHNLLTMSSGYTDNYWYPNWFAQTPDNLLSMPYINPGIFYYNNSACHLNSHILYNISGLTPIEFANIHLFPYLGIENPIWYSGYSGINDGSASLNLNLRDMVKLGQLFNQNGVSGNNQVISSDWVSTATTRHLETGYNEIPGYGYLWWIPEMEGTYLAYGYGGQFIAVIPEYDLVIGSHSTDYGPVDVNYHAINLLGIIYSELIPMFQKADINNDDLVNILDIVKLINFILGIDSPTNLQFFSSDINSDEIINIMDIIQLVQISLNNS